jgi:hypothetical protein
MKESAVNARELVGKEIVKIVNFRPLYSKVIKKRFDTFSFFSSFRHSAEKLGFAQLNPAYSTLYSKVTKKWFPAPFLFLAFLSPN